MKLKDPEFRRIFVEVAKNNVRALVAGLSKLVIVMGAVALALFWPVFIGIGINPFGMATPTDPPTDYKRIILFVQIGWLVLLVVFAMLYIEADFEHERRKRAEGSGE